MQYGHLCLARTVPNGVCRISYGVSNDVSNFGFDWYHLLSDFGSTIIGFGSDGAV